MADDTSDRAFGEEMEAPEESDNVQGSEEEVEEPESEGAEEAPEGEEAETEEEESRLTEKGTKLDPNPQSAVHQQLANERRKAQQYEQLLNNPQLLSQYMQQQFGGDKTVTTTDAPTAEFKEYKAEDFNSLDDVAGVVNSLQKGFAEKTKGYEQKIQELSGVVGQIVSQVQTQSISANIEKDATGLKELPELKKGSPEYIEGLENKIVEKFHQLDFDPNTNFYRGRVTLAQVAQDMIEAIKLGKKAGSLKAQTEVKGKAKGRVKTSPKVGDEVDENTLSPADSIAKGIAKLGLQ